MEKRRCQYDGCRAWPKRGTEWCSAHPDGRRRPAQGAPAINQNARTHGVYAAYRPVAAIEQALQLPAGDLRLEIAVVRAVIAELLAGDVAAPELVNGLVKATGALTRMLRAQRLMEPSQGDEADAVLPLVLRDLGLGERNE